MHLCNSGENARSYIGITSWTYYRHDQWAIFRFQSIIFFSFDFDVIAVSVMSFCVSMPHFTNIGSLTAEIWPLIDFQDGGRYGAILLPYQIWWRPFLQKVNVYQRTKYRQDNSIHGRDITISVLQKQTSAILKFFFQLWLWPHHRNPYDTGILHEVAKLHLYRTTNTEIWRHIDFSRWRPRRLSAISGFLLVNATVFGRSKSISKPNFVDISQFMAEI